ncbi:MAG: hypothetical protein AABO58_04875 [Acidobacteriota bacterium]
MRLAPHPSPWASFLVRLLFTTVWSGFFGVFSLMVWRHPAETPWFIFAILGFFDLIAVGMLWDVVVRFWRTLNHREPVVEIDQPMLVYGGSAQLRVTEPHPESVAEMSVRLVCEQRITTKTDNRVQQFVNRCHDQELLRLSPDTPDTLHRMLPIRMPDQPPEKDVSWKIVVGNTLRQGGTIEHNFPLRVEQR